MGFLTFGAINFLIQFYTETFCQIKLLIQNLEMFSSLESKATVRLCIIAADSRADIGLVHWYCNDECLWLVTWLLTETAWKADCRRQVYLVDYRLWFREIVIKHAMDHDCCCSSTNWITQMKQNIINKNNGTFKFVVFIILHICTLLFSKLLNITPADTSWSIMSVGIQMLIIYFVALGF